MASYLATLTVKPTKIHRNSFPKKSFISVIIHPGENGQGVRDHCGCFMYVLMLILGNSTWPKSNCVHYEGIFASLEGWSQPFLVVSLSFSSLPGQKHTPFQQMKCCWLLHHEFQCDGWFSRKRCSLFLSPHYALCHNYFKAENLLLLHEKFTNKIFKGRFS